MPVPVGYAWLKEQYGLSRHLLTHCSYIGNKESLELTSRGNVEQVYGQKYAPRENSPLHHLEFGLKYDHLSLDFLQAVFSKIPKEAIAAYIRQSPSGKYARKTGFLYEFLTGDTIEPGNLVTSNYIDLLDEEKYVTGTTVKNARWRINNNLPGNQLFCPVIRKTQALTSLLQLDIQAQLTSLQERFPPEIFTRTAHYFYTKETRSSYEIEKEKPSTDRMERFIALLMRAGSINTADMLGEQRLVALQNAIVDPRFAAPGYRDFQNFVGESLPDFHDLVHYICPPPAMVPSLMEGLQETWLKLGNTAAGIKAACIAFGLVFIHPFEDGNGRLHRFLIHDILVHEGIVPDGLIIPVSAHMLNHLKDYDHILEKYSRPLMQRIRYEKKENGEISITNTAEVAGYFRYPDLTDQCIYLLETIAATLQEDITAEFTFLQRYDETKKELQQIVDMPDRDINRMLLFLHQNNGVFPKRRRADFARLTDAEIEQMQQAYRTIFRLD